MYIIIYTTSLCRLYNRLASVSRGVEYLQLRYKDVCKRDMKACNIDTESWEVTAENRTRWKQQVSQCTRHETRSLPCVMLPRTREPEVKPVINTNKLLPQIHLMHRTSHARNSLATAATRLQHCVQIEGRFLQPDNNKMLLN